VWKVGAGNNPVPPIRLNNKLTYFVFLKLPGTIVD